jgi:hypothetical protein
MPINLSCGLQYISKMLKNSIPTLQYALSVSNANSVVLRPYGEIFTAGWNKHTYPSIICRSGMLNKLVNYINHCALWGAPLEKNCNAVSLQMIGNTGGYNLVRKVTRTLKDTHAQLHSMPRRSTYECDTDERISFV